MDFDTITNILAFTIPAMVTGAVAYYLIQQFLSHEKNLRRLQFHMSNQKESLPLRLQAYERMVLFLERINPNKLLIRVQPVTDDVDLYLNTLIDNVEQEFEHNLSQQIYMTPQCWQLIVSAKNTTLQFLRNEATTGNHKDSATFQEAVIVKGLQEQSGSDQALLVLKSEVFELL